MLDDLNYIREKDPQDALGVAAKQWQQLTHNFQVTGDKFHDISNIVLAGMGGSGWPAAYLQSWPGVTLPFEINRNYSIPRYVNQNTLFIASSYSGNTEEVISALGEALDRKAQIAVMTSGGRLKEIAKDKKLPLFELPSGTQPRMSSFYFIAALLELLAPLKIVDPKSLEDRKDISEWLKDKTNSWRPNVPTAKNPAKQLATELMGRTVIVYSGPIMAPAAHKWKISMTENAKNLAWWNQYPELNHNEFTGWTGHPTQKPFAVVEIRSNLEHSRVQKRFLVTERLLSGKRPAPRVVQPQGETIPEQLFWTSMFGDYVSIYLALLNGVNPTPVELVEKFKLAMGK